MVMAALLGVLLLMASCGNSSRPTSATDEVEVVDTMELRYAKGFRVRTLANGVRLVDVADPQTDEDRMPVSYHFALVAPSRPPRGGASRSSGRQAEMSAPPRGGREGAFPAWEGGLGRAGDNYVPVQVPVSRTIVMTMLQLSNFTALDALDVVRGITGTKNLFNKDVRERVADGRIKKIGMEGNFDTELILAAQPEVIFISPFKRGGYDAIKETGITLIPHLGYKELHPLGQAEWIKFVGLFLGKEREADSLFAEIEARYNALKEKTHPQPLPSGRGEAGAKKASGNESLPLRGDLEGSSPTVFSGEMHGGNWYAVGGKNALAQLFRDAGADYVIKDDNTGGVNVEFEQMYAQAADADYWRILNSFPGDFSYEALKASEPRNELFRAFREKHVIYCNMKQTPYYELAPVQPDVLLADLIAIFHPELMPKDYKPTFYRLLR